MAYGRRSPRRYYRGNRDKYSVEQNGFTTALGTALVNGLSQSAIEVVPATSTQGMRKVKHLTVTVTLATENDYYELFWALVYVPQGTTPNALFSTPGTPNGSLYEPNQFVMNAGVVDPSAGPIRFSSPVSRNLNSGDRIYLMVGTEVLGLPTTTPPTIKGVVRYAVTLQ